MATPTKTPTPIKWHQDQLAKFVSVLGFVVPMLNPTTAATVRDGGDGWTPLDVLGHLYDYEAIFLERARATVEQENATLNQPDPDDLVAAGAFNARQVSDLYAHWAERRHATLAYLAARDPSDWARQAQHPSRGPISLERQLALMVWHDLNHLEQIAHTVAQAQPS